MENNMRRLILFILVLLSYLGYGQQRAYVSTLRLATNPTATTTIDTTNVQPDFTIFANGVSDKIRMWLNGSKVTIWPPDSVAGGGGDSTAYIPIGTQGDILYFIAENTLANLAKSTTDIEYLSNEGVDNNPNWSQIDLRNGVRDTLQVANGGTGVGTFGGTNQILYSPVVDSIAGITTANTSALVTNSSGVPGWTSGTTANRLLRTDGTTVSFAQANLTTDVTSVLGATNGGTGQSTVTTGDLLYGSAANTWSKLAAGTQYYSLTSGGAGVAPSWQPTNIIQGVTPIRSGTNARVPFNASGIYTESAGMTFVDATRLFTILGTSTANNGSIAVNSAKFQSTYSSSTPSISLGVNGVPSAASNNIVIGNNLTAYTADSNIVIGNTTMTGTTDGNIVIGNSAGTSLSVNDNRNILIGTGTGSSTTGTRQVVIGYDSEPGIANASGELSIQNIIYGTSNLGTGTTLSEGRIGIGIQTPTGKFQVANHAGVASTYQLFTLYNSAGTEMFDVLESGDWQLGGSSGTSGHVLTSNGSGSAPTWQAATGGLTDPMTTRGDIIIRDATNTTARLGIGANTYVLTSNGTDVSWAAPTGGGGLTVGTSTITSGTNTRVLYNNSGVLGEYTVSGSGNVAMTTSPTFTTPILGTPTSGTLTNATGYLWSNLAGTGTPILASAVTTGTGATAGHQITANSLTTGNGLEISTTSGTTGSALVVASTSTTTDHTSGTSALAEFVTSGANGTASKTAIAARFSSTNTGTTNTNEGISVAASGGSTANHAIHVTAGDVLIDGSSLINYSAAGDFQYPNTQTAALSLTDGTTDHLIIDSSNDEVEVPVNLAIGTTSASSRLDVVSDNAATNTSTTVAEFVSTSTGTPAAGKGANIHLMAETAAANVETAVIVDGTFSDVTSTGEDGKAEISVMADGTTTNAKRLQINGQKITLTESSATTIFSFTASTQEYGSLEFFVTVYADDGSNNHQIRTMHFVASWVFGGAGIEASISTPVECEATDTGTLTATATIIDAGSSVVAVQINAVSSLTQTVLNAQYQIRSNYMSKF